MGSNLKLYILIIIFIILAVVGFLLWQNSQKQADKPEGAGGLGTELYQDTSNPAENLPAVNPLENKPEVNPLNETNPFTDIKTNPFE